MEKTNQSDTFGAYAPNVLQRIFPVTTIAKFVTGLKFKFRMGSGLIN